MKIITTLLFAIMALSVQNTPAQAQEDPMICDNEIVGEPACRPCTPEDECVMPPPCEPEIDPTNPWCFEGTPYPCETWEQDPATCAPPSVDENADDSCPHRSDCLMVTPEPEDQEIVTTPTTTRPVPTEVLARTGISDDLWFYGLILIAGGLLALRARRRWA